MTTTSLLRCLSSQSLSYPIDHQQYQTTAKRSFTFINIFQSVQDVCFSDLFPFPKLYKKNVYVFSDTFMAKIVRCYYSTQNNICDKNTDIFNIFSLHSSSIYTVSGKKGATWFFAVTLPNPNRSSKFFYYHTLQ